MKKLLTCILLTAILLSLFGCSEKTVDSDNSDNSESKETAVSEADEKEVKSYDIKEEEIGRFLSLYVNYYGRVLKKESQGDGLTVYVFYQEYSHEFNMVSLFHDDEGNISGLDISMYYQYDENLGEYVINTDVDYIITMLIAKLHGVAPADIWEHFYPEDAPKDVEGTFEGSKYWVRYKDKKVSIMLNPKQ